MINPELDPEYKNKMEAILRETLFSSWDPGFFTSAGYENLVDDHAFGRYRSFRDSVLPWISEVKPLGDCVVLEIGSGSGSCAAAIAPHTRKYIGFEIDPASVVACNKRMELLGLQNVEIVSGPFSGGACATPDVVLFMASLEHMTFDERIGALRESWEMLSKGGILVVTDTPNGLAPFDHHTSDLPFYHWLSNDVRGFYGLRSPRADFKGRVQQYATIPTAARDECLVREGIGASFLDFEIALGGDIHSYVIADGTEKAIMRAIGTTFEDSLVQLLFDHYKIPAHRCFARRALYFILQKPA